VSVPATGTSGPLIVTAPSGTRVSSKNFNVQPAISGFSPPSGAVGSQVVITGTGLTQTSAVSFGGGESTLLYGELRNTGDGNCTDRRQNRKDPDHHTRWNRHKRGNFDRNVRHAGKESVIRITRAERQLLG